MLPPLLKHKTEKIHPHFCNYTHVSHLYKILHCKIYYCSQQQSAGNHKLDVYLTASEPFVRILHKNNLIVQIRDYKERSQGL